jgi:hypothetical protein
LQSFPSHDSQFFLLSISNIFIEFMTMTKPADAVLIDASPEPDYEELEFDPYVTIRRLIWVYIILWIIEGGLRRWFFPGLATPLLLVRDPVAIAIYFLAISKRVFPFNGFIITGALLAFVNLLSALTLGHGNIAVALYGDRCDFLHVPLIFIMGEVLRKKDLVELSRVAIWLVIPYTALIIAQFYAPQSAWVNRGVAGSLDGAGFSGAEGHYRPPGTFSFISGPAFLYPLFTACWFVFLFARQLPIWLMLASGVAILLAVPASISRTLFFAVLIVAVVGLVAMIFGGKVSLAAVMQFILGIIFIPLLANQIPAFQEAMSAFLTRWNQTTNDETGGIKSAVFDRVFDSFFGNFSGMGFIGLGTGFSTNVGQMILTKEVGFGAAEAEWGRLMFDNGLILGSLMVAYRVVLTGYVFFKGVWAWRRGHTESLIFLSACFLGVLQGQWGQATTLGAAVISAGIALASTKEGDFIETESSPTDVEP